MLQVTGVSVLMAIATLSKNVSVPCNENLFLKKTGENRAILHKLIGHFKNVADTYSFGFLSGTKANAAK